MATRGQNENRSSTTELLPDVQKAIVQPDFTLNHYDIDHNQANFDLNPPSGLGRARGSLAYDGSGTPTDLDRFYLYDFSGKVAKYIISTSVDFVEWASTAVPPFSGGHVVIGIKDAPSAERMMGSIAQAIKYQTTFVSYIGVSLSSDGLTINLSQQFAGPQGNTAIGGEVANIDFSNFSGGFSPAQPPFSKRFQLVRPIATSGLAISRNGHMTQG